MARTAVLTKQQIIEAAFTLADQQGVQSVTIRDIGNLLGKSTAPIYTQYERMEDIFKDLTEYVHQLFMEYTSSVRSKDAFLNIGLGYIAFVLDHKHIYTDFFLSPTRPPFKMTSETENALYIEQMKSSPLLRLLDDNRLHQILEDMIVYTYGLAIMICSEIGQKQTLEYYKEKLGQAGHRFISYHLYSSGQYERALAELSK